MKTTSVLLISGLYNSSAGASNNADMKLEKFSYLPSTEPDFTERWVPSTTTTNYFFYTASEDADNITCDGNSGLKHTNECTPVVKTCKPDLRENQDDPCGMMSVIYLTITTNLVSKFDEVDPVQWGEIIGSLGG
jgi:hypothetical protein